MYVQLRTVTQIQPQLFKIYGHLRTVQRPETQTRLKVTWYVHCVLCWYICYYLINMCNNKRQKKICDNETAYGELCDVVHRRY